MSENAKVVSSNHVSPIAFGPTSTTQPDWTRKCENCGATPIVPLTGMCGPCTFGDARTANGGWWE
jgi:hypothetical protein